jgi:hypothetical protein
MESAAVPLEVFKQTERCYIVVKGSCGLEFLVVDFVDHVLDELGCERFSACK